MAKFFIGRPVAAIVLALLMIQLQSFSLTFMVLVTAPLASFNATCMATAPLLG